MQCPIDQTILEMSNRNNIEIDYCPTCRGVWLDRGELDKIIDRSEQQQSAPASPSPARDEDSGHRDPHEQKKTDSYHGSHKKKRESFIGDLFDF
jgi:hypothetical protein